MRHLTKGRTIHERSRARVRVKTAYISAKGQLTHHLFLIHALTCCAVGEGEPFVAADPLTCRSIIVNCGEIEGYPHRGLHTGPSASRRYVVDEYWETAKM